MADFRLPVVRVFAGNRARALTGYGAVEIAFDRNGPAQARVTLPRLVSGVRNPATTADALFPQGEGVLIEVDARTLGTNERSAAVGVPDLWLGRVTDPEAGDGSTPDVTVGANGPMVDLGTYSTPVRATPMSGPAGAIAAELVRAYPVDLRVDVGAVHRGRPIQAPAGGDSVAAVLAALAEAAGEEFTLVPLPDVARWRMDWTDALSPPDLTGAAGGRAVTLTDDGVRQNARITPTYTMTRSRADLVMAGAAWDRGGPMAVRATVDATALGRRAGLEALVATSAVQRFVDTAAITHRPDLSTLGMLENAAVTALRQAMRPPLPFQAEVLDTGLWRYMRPLNLVLMRLPDEASGLYANAIAQIRTTTFSVTPPLGCQISGELWSTES